MQIYTIYLYLETALHVSGGTSTHHQERTQLYLQHLAFVTPLLLSTAIVGTAGTVVCAPDDGWRYHPKHVEQFPNINKLCKVASSWIYIRIHLRCADL
jgi:regulator of RNase E activity RraA